MPWVLFMFISEYIKFKGNEIEKKEFIKKSIIPTGVMIVYIVLDFYLPIQYDNYLDYSFLVVFILFFYFYRNTSE